MAAAALELGGHQGCRTRGAGVHAPACTLPAAPRPPALLHACCPPPPLGRRFNGQMAGARQVDACRELCPGGGLTLRAWAEDHRDQLRRVMRQGGGSNFMKGRKVG